jgi:chromosome partitioning protein
MKIISLWDEKGGCGKSTLTIALAGAASSRGLKVLVVDEDPQGTCAMLAEDNNFDFAVSVGFPDEAPEVDLILVDMAPNTNTVPYGAVILPYQPTRISFSVAVKHRPFLLENATKLIEVVSMVDLRKKTHRDFLKGNTTLKINSRSIYERLTNEATSLYSPEYKNLSGAREARKEINALLDEALS